MLKDCVIWDGRGRNDYSPPLVIKTARGELWRIMTAILYFAFVKDVFFVVVVQSQRLEKGGRMEKPGGAKMK